MDEMHTDNQNSATRFNGLAKASLIAILVDVFLIALKYILSLLTQNTVIYADALHSGGDLAVSATVFISIVADHYFRDRKWAKYTEKFVALLISFFIINFSLQLVLFTLQNNITPYVFEPRSIPLVLAFTGISVACWITFKMSQYKSMIGKKYNSDAFSAESKHTYADFWSSFGVWFTLLLGYLGIHIERVMTIIVGLVVLKIGVQLFFKALPPFIYLVKKGIIIAWSNIVLFTGKVIPGSWKEKGSKSFRWIYTNVLKNRPGKADLNILKNQWGRVKYYFTGSKLKIPSFLLIQEEQLLKYFSSLVVLNIIIILILYASTGFYQVLPHQTGIEHFLGVVVEQNGPGLHIHAPVPFGKFTLVDTEIATRVETGFRTNMEYQGQEPDAYLWEFTHNEGRYQKNNEEAIAITGDENLIDINFICYYHITDPVKFKLGCENAHETLRNLLCHEAHKVVGRYHLDSLLTSAKSEVQDELLLRMIQSEKKLSLGVTIFRVYMQEVHPPIAVVPNYRAVASSREQKDEIIHKANAYVNEHLPNSRGLAWTKIALAKAYNAERTFLAIGEIDNFRRRKEYFDKYRTIEEERLRWKTLEKILIGKSIYILPKNSQRRFLSSLNTQGGVK